jgi:O-antigen/teichoic acid export membrane protein
MCSLVAGSTAGWMILSNTLLCDGRFKEWNAVRLGAACGWLVAVCSGVAAARQDWEASGVLVIVAVAATSWNVTLALVTLRILSSAQHRGSIVRTPTIRAILPIGLPVSLGTALVLANSRIDQVFVANLFAARDLGQYVVAAGYCFLVTMVLQSIGSLTLPRISEQTGVSRLRAIELYSSAALWVGLLVGVGAWIAAPIVIPILNGPEFSEAASIARVLVVGAVAAGVAGVIEQGLKAHGMASRYMRVELLGFVALITSLSLFASKGLLWAAACSSVAAIVVLALVGWSVGSIPGVSGKALATRMPRLLVSRVRSRRPR